MGRGGRPDCCVLGAGGRGLPLHESVLALVLQEERVEDRGPILHESGLDLLLHEGMVEAGDPISGGFWVPAPTRSQVVIRVIFRLTRVRRIRRPTLADLRSRFRHLIRR